MKYSKFTLLRLYWFSFKDRGVVLPITIGLGLIAVLVGTIMLTRSFRDQTSVVASQLTTGSQAIAELGVTRSLDLINQFRAIASVPPCGSSWKNGECGNNSTPSWYAVTNETIQTKETKTTEDIKLSSLINDVTSPARTFSASVTNADIPSCTAQENTNTKTVANFANQKWQNTTRGQFRLVNYVYDGKAPDDANDNVGTLTVEGGIGQTSGNITPNQTAGTGITRLEVAFPVRLQPPWGLWIRGGESAPLDHQTMTVPKQGVKADIRDSGCADDTSDKTARVTEINSLLSQGVKYVSTPGKYFGDLFPQPSFDNFEFFPPEGGELKISSGDRTISKGGDYYIIQNTNNDGRSIDISGDGRLLVNAPGQRVRIYLAGELYLDGANRNRPVIEVTKGTTLELYVDGRRIQVLGNSLVKNAPENTPDNFQIYTPADSTGTHGETAFTLQGIFENVFVFAPNQILTQSGSKDKPGRFTGTLWARSWRGSGDSGEVEFTQGKPPVFKNLAIACKSGKKYDSCEEADKRSIEDISINTIGKIISWRRCEATGDRCP